MPRYMCSHKHFHMVYVICILYVHFSVCSVCCATLGCAGSGSMSVLFYFSYKLMLTTYNKAKKSVYLWRLKTETTHTHTQNIYISVNHFAF